jgi:hypothetical protein
MSLQEFNLGLTAEQIRHRKEREECEKEWELFMQEDDLYGVLRPHDFQIPSENERFKKWKEL